MLKTNLDVVWARDYCFKKPLFLSLRASMGWPRGLFLGLIPGDVDVDVERANTGGAGPT